MKTMKKYGIYSLCFLLIAFTGFIGFISSINQKYVVPIIMYHHVVPHSTPAANYVTPEVFEEQMAYLKNNDYQVLTLDELVSRIQSNHKFKKKSVAITFDDGYEDNYIYAYKVLKKYNFPATLFIQSNTIGTYEYLSWPQVKEMAAHNISFGSHAQYPIYLPILSKDQQDDEIILSKAKIENMLNQRVDYFAYPIGGFNDRIKHVVQEAGYKAAFATNRGVDRFNRDIYELNRVRLSENDDNPLFLWIKLSGYYNLFRKMKNSE